MSPKPASSPRRVPTLLVPLRNRAHLFDVYFHREGSDGVFIAGEAAFEVGDPLFLELSFLEEQRAFRLRGVVRWRRLRTGRQALQPGIGVEFDATEHATRDLVLQFARGREVDFTVRADHRLPVTMRIAYQSDAQFLTDMADDFSRGGAFITTEHLLEVGTLLDLKLKPPGHLLGIKVRGVVAWRSTTKNRHGMGIKFVFDNERKKRQVEAIVDELKESIIREMRIQVPR